MPKKRRTNQWMEDWFDWKLRDVVHKKREEVFKGTKKSWAYNWTKALMGTTHISEMNREQLFTLLVHLKAKELTGHSLRIKPKGKTKGFKVKSFKVPFTNYIIGVFVKVVDYVNKKNKKTEKKEIGKN